MDFKNDIDWIFFDMGFTLIDEDGAHKPRIDYILDRIKEKNVAVSRDEFVKRVYEAGVYASSPMRAAAASFGVTDVPTYVPDGEALYDDVRDILRKLSAKYDLGVIANQSRGSGYRLRKHGIAHDFDAVFGSAETGLRKPDIGFYEYALRETGCMAQRAVMIGDRPDNDIEPAQRLGMRTIRIRRGFFKMRPDTVKPDRTIYSLSELAEIFDV